jgi:hypothetical protein
MLWGGTTGAVIMQDDVVAIPGYAAFRLLGRGGFSAVYQARQEDYDRSVAVKVIDIGVDDEATRRRFGRECAATGRLTGHPNILTLLDSGFLADGHPYLTTALCPGGSLGERVEREGALPVADVLRVGVKIAGALQTAHSNGIVHRDIKPANILLTAFDEPALADFGISLVQQERATTQRTQAYTASHAPPEVLSGALADEASDIYSLGSTLYQLLAGRPAFRHAGDLGLASFVHQVLYEPLPPLSEVPPSLQRLVQTAMAKAPADRFDSAAEMGRALQAVQRELGVRVDEMVLAAPGADQDPTMLVDLERQVAPVVGEPTGRATASRGRRRAVVAGVLAAAVLLGGAAVVVSGLSGERQVAGGSAATTTAESSTRTAEPTTTSATGPGPFRNPSQCGKLASHEALRAGRVLRACEGDVKLTMRRDGNLVVSRAKRKLWESGTAGHRGARLTMRDSGALVVAIPETKRVLWSSHTGGHRGAWLAVQDDGRLVVYSSARKVLWSGGAR